jgi:GTP-binding protein HflX
VPRILVLNKIDLVTDPELREGLARRHPGARLISVRTGAGISELFPAMEAALTSDSSLLSLRIPDAEYALVALLRREAQIVDEGREEEASLLTCRVPPKLVEKFKAYLV